MKVWLKLALFAAAVSAALLALALNVLQFALDSTPRTGMSLANLRAVLPPESLAPLAISLIALVFGFVVDRLWS